MVNLATLDTSDDGSLDELHQYLDGLLGSIMYAVKYHGDKLVAPNSTEAEPQEFIQHIYDFVAEGRGCIEVMRKHLAGLGASEAERLREDIAHEADVAYQRALNSLIRSIPKDAQEELKRRLYQ
jgi:hypothetical protein